jgi:hypothetical protein
LLKGDELYAELPQLIDDLQEMWHATAEPIKPPDHDYVEAISSGIGQKLCQTGPNVTGTTDSVSVDTRNAPAALAGKVTEWLFLNFRPLIKNQLISPRPA